MHALSVSSHRPIAYPTPGPHGLAARGEVRPGTAAAAAVACAESAPLPGSYPVEQAILRADALALSLSAALARLAAPLARAALGFVRARGWSGFGYARLDDHARERFGRCGVWVRMLAGIGAGLERLPALADALTGDDGGPPLGTEATRLVARVATTATLEDWVAAARRMRVRELRRVVAAAELSRGAGGDGDVWPADLEGGGAASAHKEEATGSGRGAVMDAARPSGAMEAGVERDVGVDADAADPRLIRLLVPTPVAAAFDEALDLYRAVVGGEASVASFVEALVADAMAGADPPVSDDSFDMVGLRRSASREQVEEALDRSTSGWSHLPETGRSSWALALAGASLERFARVATRAGTGDAVALESQIRELLVLEDEMDRRLGDLLSEMGGMGAWSRLGFDSVEHYAGRRLGLCRTAARQRVRAARGVRRYPVLKQAYESGDIGLESCLHLLRFLGGADRGRGLGGSCADEAVQREWVDHARAATVKRMRDEGRAFSRRFAVDEGARAEVWPPVWLPMSDARWHASLRREAGMALRRVARLGRAVVDALDARSDLAPGAGADVFLRLRLPGQLASDFAGAVEAARSRLVRRVASVPWDQSWPDDDAAASVLAARSFFIRCRRAPAWVGLLALLEEFVATFDVDAADRDRKESAVYSRDGYRCAAAGCTSRANLHCHHLEYRSRRGSEHPSNKVCLCAWHHLRGEHGGLASFRGRAPLQVVCRLGREGLASWFRNEVRVSTPGAHSVGRSITTR